MQNRVTDQEIRDTEKKLLDCYGNPTPDAVDFMSRSLARMLGEIKELQKENAGLRGVTITRRPNPR